MCGSVRVASCRSRNRIRYLPVVLCIDLPVRVALVPEAVARVVSESPHPSSGGLGLAGAHPESGRRIRSLCPGSRGLCAGAGGLGAPPDLESPGAPCGLDGTGRQSLLLVGRGRDRESLALAMGSGVDPGMNPAVHQGGEVSHVHDLGFSAGVVPGDLFVQRTLERAGFVLTGRGGFHPAGPGHRVFYLGLGSKKHPWREKILAR